MSTSTSSTDLQALLGDEADALLGYTAKAFPAEHLTLPGPNYLERVFADSDRNPTVLRNLGSMFDHGRLGGTGYLSILPVDQGIEHSAAASFSKNPAYFDPLNLVELALAGECNAVATTLGTLGLASRKYVHRIPFIVKLNHNAFLHVPNTYDQIMFGSRPPGLRPRGRRRRAPPSTSAPTTWTASSSRCPRPSPRPTGSGCSPCCGATCATRPSRRTASTTRSRPTSPARPTTWASRSRPTSSSRSSRRTTAATRPSASAGPTRSSTTQLTTDNPIDLTRWQVVNCYAGRIGLINSGGESKGDSDLAQAVRTAVINKRAGGMGLIVGRKAFQRPMAEGAALIHTIQDVYLDKEVTIA